MSKIATGWYYENIAIEYLIRNNYKVLEKNFYGTFGELDIIAYLNKEYVFIEVKSISKESGYSIYQTLTKLKYSKINKTAQHWLRQKRKENAVYRIEFIGIIGYSDKYYLEHFKYIQF